MILNAYSILDEKAQRFGSPLFFERDELVVRIFSDVCNNPEYAIGMHPVDYVLYQVGMFDDETGVLIASLSVPRLIARGGDLVGKGDK